MSNLKILFSGPMGAGKTTAIAAISQIAPFGTEVLNSDPEECAKETTTVALDYGELTLDANRKLMLFGAPGQERFSFLRSSLADGALGVVILIDNSRMDPLGDLVLQLASFDALLIGGCIVVGVGRTDSHPRPPIEAHRAVADAAGANVPVFSIDVRRRKDVHLLLEALLCQIEARGGHS